MNESRSTARVVWRYWLPLRAENEGDARTWLDHPWRDPDFVAADIAERKWHEDSPDYFDEEIIALVTPQGETCTYDVTVEVVPSFRARKRT